MYAARTAAPYDASYDRDRGAPLPPPPPEVSSIWELKTARKKLIWRKIKTLRTLPEMKNLMAQVNDETHAKKKHVTNFDGIGLRSLVI